MSEDLKFNNEDIKELDYTWTIPKLHIECKYCKEPVEGTSGEECILNMIYHVHEKHGSRSLEAVNL